MSKIYDSPSEPVYTGMDQWQTLANAIVLQSVKDFRAAQKTIIRTRKRLSNQAPLKDDEYERLCSQRDRAQLEMVRIEHFFRSKWFGVLTTIDPDALLQTLRKEVA